MLEEVRSLVGPWTSPGQRLDLAAAEARLAPEGPERQAARGRLAAEVAELSDRDLAAVPVEARRAAAELVGTHPGAVVHVLRLVGRGTTFSALARLLHDDDPEWQGLGRTIDPERVLVNWVMGRGLDNPDRSRTIATMFGVEEDVASRRGITERCVLCQDLPGHRVRGNSRGTRRRVQLRRTRHAHPR